MTDDRTSSSTHQNDEWTQIAAQLGAMTPMAPISSAPASSDFSMAPFPLVFPTMDDERREPAPVPDAPAEATSAPVDDSAERAARPRPHPQSDLRASASPSRQAPRPRTARQERARTTTQQPRPRPARRAPGPRTPSSPYPLPGTGATPARAGRGGGSGRGRTGSSGQRRKQPPKQGTPQKKKGTNLFNVIVIIAILLFAGFRVATTIRNNVTDDSSTPTSTRTATSSSNGSDYYDEYSERMAEISGKTDSFPRFDPVTRTGSGNGTVEGLSVDHVAVLHFECPQCSGYTSLETDSDKDDYPLSGDGPQDAHVLVGATGGTITSVTVSANADWTLTVEDLNSLPTTDGVMDGNGSQVFVYTGSQPHMSMTYQGDSNFMVHSFQDQWRDSLANEIGPSSLTADVQPGVIEVEAEGTWTMTPTQ